MRVIFTKLASQELEDAVRYYELEYSGLGRRFKEEVRKCLLHKFPYKLMYSVEGNHILVIAVAHQHRNPDYWVDRNET